MKETRIMQVFEQYIKKFNMNKNNTKCVYFHCIKVMDLCKNIASVLGIFSKEEIIVCELIGLFHDISLFENKDNGYTLLPKEDTSKRSIEILFGEDGLMRKITEDTTYDEIIKIAIYCQNKNGLPSKLNDKMLHYCKVLKDAHTLDTFRIVLNYPCIDMHIDNYPSNNIYENFKHFQVMRPTYEDNDADAIIIVLSQVFAINYLYSYSLLNEEQFVNKVTESLIFKDKNIMKFFKQINMVLNNYITRKIGG